MRGLVTSLRQRFRSSRFPVDVAIGIGVAVLGCADVARPIESGSALRPADLWGFAVVLSLAACAAVRRLVPRSALIVALGLAVALSVLGYRQSPVSLPLVLLLYTVGSQVPWRAAAPALILVPVAILAMDVTSRDDVPGTEFAGVVVFLVGAWLLGFTLRTRREEAARQAVVSERLRIAREVHDIVSHSMSVVAVQSGVALHLLDEDPKHARDSLSVIASTSRQALEEMRRLLDVLNLGHDDEDHHPHSPVPQIRDLPDLADEARSSGVVVDLDVQGPIKQVAAGVGLTTYRIVQESLTNTLRHAGPGSRAHVSVRCQAHGVAIEVLDDGNGMPAAAGRGAKAGIFGMRGRAALYHGDLEAGPRPGGGWRVAAWLPNHREPA